MHKLISIIIIDWSYNRTHLTSHILFSEEVSFNNLDGRNRDSNWTDII